MRIGGSKGDQDEVKVEERLRHAPIYQNKN